MLGFLITLAVIGGLIGLLFSKKGEEGNGFWSGAKTGLVSGCGCLVLLTIILIILIVLIFCSGLISLNDLGLDEFSESLQNISVGLKIR